MILLKKWVWTYFGLKSPGPVAEDRQGFKEFFLKSICTCFVLDHYWSGITIFFPLSYQMISNELVMVASGSKNKIKVIKKLKYLSHSKVELLYLFKRHTSDFLVQAFWRILGLIPSLRNKLGYLLLFLCVLHSNGGVMKKIIFFNWPLCVSVSAFLLHHLLLFYPPCK